MLHICKIFFHRYIFQNSNADFCKFVNLKCYITVPNQQQWKRNVAYVCYMLSVTKHGTDRYISG